MRIINLVTFSFVVSLCHGQSIPKIPSEGRVVFRKMDTTYVFYTSKGRGVQIKNDHVYAWFSKDSIFNTQEGYSGRLLNGLFEVYYPSGALFIKGQYKLGLRTGEWKKWNRSGVLLERFSWRDGELNGSFTVFDTASLISTTGAYSRNKLDGWIIRSTKDSVVSRQLYDKGWLNNNKAKIK